MIYRITLLIILLNFLNPSVFSQDGTLSIDMLYVHIDSKKKMILVNKPVESLNAGSSGSISSISAGGINYTLITPVSAFELGTAYELAGISGDHFDLYFTSLPVVTISTGKTIVNEPRVFARFLMCDTKGNIVESLIGIEHRGNWSRSLPKKSFRIECWNDSLGVETKDCSLPGMRSDDDWNLQAMCNEPLRLRSKLGYELWNKMDTLYYLKEEPQAINGVRQKYTELFLNDEYQGLYALSERIDRKQLKLKKYKDQEIRGELYKGMVWGAPTFTALPQYNNNNALWGGFKYEYPDEIINWSKLYSFVDYVIHANQEGFNEHYSEMFSVDNAVNYFIFLNLLRAKDNTGKNIFIAKYDKDEPYFYIPWDLDGTFGMLWDGTKDAITDGLYSNGFFKRMVLDDSEHCFLQKLQIRWNALKTNVLSVDSIMTAFETQYAFLLANGVYERELKAWPNCAFYDEHNLEYTREWLTNRFAYLDVVFNHPEQIAIILQDKSIERSGLSIFPNPAGQFVHLEISDGNLFLKKILIVDISGKAIRYYEVCSNKWSIDVSNIEDGLYFILVEYSNGAVQTDKLIIKK